MSAAYDEVTLFDVEDEDWWAWAVPVDGPAAPACCRFCHTASTAAGIVRYEHGPDSRTCERMRARIAELEAAGGAA